ncbi:hypothetical protein AAMO2058_000938600 [Amorphochlora amoebiformis]
MDVRGFANAPQAHILRSLQKDQYYISWLLQRLENLAVDTYGHHAARADSEIRLAAYVCYFGLTTLLGKQTLGEEYCDILQVDRSHRPPSKLRRWCLVALQCLVPYIYRRLSAAIRHHTDVDEDSDSGAHLGSVLRAYCQALIRVSQPFVEPARDLHTAIFYLFGRYLEIAKSLCGVEYIFLQRARGQVGYQVLGILLGTQLMGSMLVLTIERLRDLASSPPPAVEAPEKGEEDRSIEDDDCKEDPDAPKCVFCFDRRRNTTATECGHLFCWECIVSCCDRKVTTHAEGWK